MVVDLDIVLKLWALLLSLLLVFFYDQFLNVKKGYLYPEDYGKTTICLFTCLRM